MTANVRFLKYLFLSVAFFGHAEAYAQLFATVGRSYPGSPSFNFDADGAVGPDHYAEITNNGVRIVALADGSVRYNASQPNFWRKVLGEAPGAYDPHIEYDHASGRWFAIALTRTDIYLGVSDNSDPTGSWKACRFGLRIVVHP